MHVRKILLLFIALFVSLTLVACGNDSSKSEPVPTDYSQAAHWLSLPATVKAVDVFYLYPTAWQKVNNSDSDICEIDNPSMLAGSASVFARQATAFETVGNIYAPYYRQYSNSAIKRLETIAGIPTLDAVAAFDYYIKHFNNNRPFILVGHSQGATVLTNLLAGYMKEHPDVYSRMIAAYVIGSPVTQAYLENNPYLKFATGPDDTGVIISWNTEAPVVNGTNPVLYDMVGLVINPITWTTDETLATKDEGLGSFLPVPPSFVFGPVPQYADAQIDKAKGVLICSTANQTAIDILDEYEGFPDGVYHAFDIPFYYYNLRANAQNRVNNFLGH